MADKVVKMWLEDGPLDGEQYSFKGNPIEDTIIFKYGGERLIYAYEKEYTLKPVVIYRYVGKDPNG